MSRRLILFAPGAGAPSSHPWMQNWKQRLSEIGDVETFDYDYMREGRKRPDPLPQLIAAHRKALEAGARETSTGLDIPDRQKHGRPHWMSRVARGKSGRFGLSWISALRHGRSHKTSRRSFARADYAHPVCARHARFALSVGSSGARSSRNESAKLFAHG